MREKEWFDGVLIRLMGFTIVRENVLFEIRVDQCVQHGHSLLRLGERERMARWRIWRMGLTLVKKNVFLGIQICTTCLISQQGSVPDVCIELIGF